MNQVHISLSAVLLGMAVSAFSSEAMADTSNLLWYKQPAQKWVQALPVGNGRLGAMIFGQPVHERLQLNDVTVWSGGPQPNANRKDAYKSLPELRRLIREKKYVEAEKFANAHFTGPAPSDASYQTLGDLNFEFQLPPGKVENYKRWLDLDSATATTEFQVDGTMFSTKTFASHTLGAINHQHEPMSHRTG